MHITTKQELENWIIKANNAGNSVPCYQRGGGFTWITDWETSIEISGNSFSTDDDFEDKLDYVSEGEEINFIKSYMTADELEGVTFIRVNHRNGYNQENMDYYFGIYDI